MGYVSHEAHDPLRVLFVCTANICRSPYMELRARTLAPAGEIVFSSAGTHGFDGAPVDPTMAQVMTELGIDRDLTRAFRSRPLTRSMVEDADVILTAERSHRSYVLEEVPRAFAKTFTLGQILDSFARVDESLRSRAVLAAVGRSRAAVDDGHDIIDPHGRGLSASARCAEQIDAVLPAVLARLGGSA